MHEGKRGPSVQVLGAGRNQGNTENDLTSSTDVTTESEVAIAVPIAESTLVREPTIESVEQGLSQCEPLLVDAFIGEGKPLFVKAMADTGNRAQNVLDSEVADLLEEQWQLPKLKLRKPMELCGFNGHPVPPAREMMLLPLQIGKHRETMAPCIITKSKYPLILSKGWMAAHGAIADPVRNQLLFVYDVCQHPGAVTTEALDGNPYSTGPQPTEILNPHVDRQGNPMRGEAPMMQILKRTQLSGKSRNVPRADMVQDLRQLHRDVEHEKIESTTNLVTKAPSRRTSTKVSDICMISGPAFNVAARQKGAEIFAISMKEIEEQRSKDEQAKEAAINLKDLMPEELHEWIDVAQADQASSLPEHRPQWDMKLQLREDKSLPNPEPLRRMTPDENEALHAYLQENLAKGWIIPSTADFHSPILFVKKPGGGLRLCVDYRALNEVTKRNRYPLPLIDEIIQKVKGCKFFTRLDIIKAFHRLRMATEFDEDLTTFICKWGAYKFRVMPFGLSGGPGTFQQFMNDNFLEFQEFAACYIDDILIFSKSKKEHIQHVQRVLQRLREMGLTIDILKSEFYAKEVKFLGLIVEEQGIRMDPRKVEQIQNWTRPRDGRDLKGVRQFLGFVNFFRRFILRYAKVARPLYNLLMKESPGIWTDACEKAFEELKTAVSSDTVMMHFDCTKEAFVECDSSDVMTGGVLSQLDGEGRLRPVAYLSKSLIPAERNYAIYDKEMLAIIRCFEEWRPELLSAGMQAPVQVLTDHKALEYFMTTKQLTRRQARWAEFLSQFNFKITYRPGARNTKADLLTRLANEDELPRAKKDPHLNQQLLSSEQISEEVKEDLGLELLEDLEDEVESDSEEESFEEETTSNSTSAPASKEPSIAISTPTDVPATLEEVVIAANKKDEVFTKIREKLTQSEERNWTLDGFRATKCKDHDGILYAGDRLAVPNNKVTEVIEAIHASREVGHAGRTKTLRALQKNYAFPSMKTLVGRFIANCHDCRRAKSRRELPQGLLQPLPVPERPWTDIAVDFVVELPETPRGNDCIMAVVDRLSKERHYIACRGHDKGISAESTAWMFYKNVWRMHGLPNTIVSDRGTQFASQLFQHLCKILKITSKMSTAFHPQTDGQTENANQEMERYLRTYVSQNQDDWDLLLPSAEFAINAAQSESTKLSPFMATRGYEPRMSFDARVFNKQGKTARERVAFTKARSIAKHMQEIWTWAKSYMAAAQEAQTEAANKHRRPVEIKLGDKVWLNMKNVKTERPNKKLDSKWEGPFEVVKEVGKAAFKLNLPETMKIHSVFHASLLSKASEDPLPGQEFSQPDAVNAKEGEGDEYEVEEIMDVKNAQGNILKAQAKWLGWPKDLTWYPITNFKNVPELLQDFYEQNPQKPKPKWLAQRLKAVQAEEETTP